MRKHSYERPLARRRRLKSLLAAACLAGTMPAGLAFGQQLPGPEFVPSADYAAAPAAEPLRVEPVSNGATLLTAEQIKLIVAEHLAEEEKKKESKDSKAKEYVVSSDTKMTASWKNGIELISANKDFKLHVGGRTQLDWVALQSDQAFLTPGTPAWANGGFANEDAVAFRRARMRVDGTMYETIEWCTEIDFTNNANTNPGTGAANNGGASEHNVYNYPAPTDLWIQFTHLPTVGTLQIGNLKDPHGMEHLTSSRFLDFLERSFMQDAYTGPFNNGFIPGVKIYNTFNDEQGTWAASVSKYTSNVFAYNVGDAEYAATTRGTYLLYYDEPTHGRYLLHVGGSFRALQSDFAQANASQGLGGSRIRARGSLRNGPGSLNATYGDTGTFFSDSQYIAAAELAGVAGAFNFQAEYMSSWHTNARGTPNGASLGDYRTQGYYVQALYFLTGEHREYEKKQGVFGRPIPYENAFLVPGRCGNLFGRGAWQIGARFNYLDLRDTGIRDGGVVQDVTLGLNWFMNPNVKWQANFVITDRSPAGNPGVHGQQEGAGVRLAWDF